jgi:outer membrane protein assembly factor BamB
MRRMIHVLIPAFPAVARGFGVAGLLAVLILPLQAQRPGNDWNQWRGPSRDGSAPAPSDPKAWPEKLTQKWKVDVGSGYATPLVVGNRIYQFSRQGEREVMSALDADSGKVLWQTGHDAPFTMHSATTQHGPGPKSTPAFANGRLFAIGMTGIVTAYDANTGKQLWQKPGSTPLPLYTTHSFSPLVDGGQVVFHVGGDNAGALTAYDVNTGVDASNGTLLWERPFVITNKTNSVTPVVHGRTIIVSGNGEPTRALAIAKRANQWVTDIVWENADIPLRMSDAVVVGDVLFGLANRNSGQYFAVDAATGKTLWTSEGRQATHAAIARSGDLFLSLEDDGELVVVRNSKTAFEPLHRYKVADAATWGQPAYSGNRVLVKDVSTLSLWTLN